MGLDGSQDCKCKFGHLDAVQPHGSKKNNMADSDKHVFFGKYVHTIKLPAAPRGHVNQTEEGKRHMREQTPSYV